MGRKPHRQGSSAADPSLRQAPPGKPFRPFGLPRWAAFGLYALFSSLLIIPLVRRWRRHPRWPAVRAAFGLSAAAGLAAAWAQGWSTWVWAPLLLVVLAAAWLAPTTDPDRERKLQRRHQAQYLLNGGRFGGGELPNSEPLRDGEPLYLLLRGEHLLLVPREGDGEVHSALPIRRMAHIEVDGEPYLPIYVSEAKDPPVKESVVDREAVSTLALTFEDGQTVRFGYPGAFHKHLAETAAHAIYSVREQLLRPQPAELTQILR